MSLSRRRFLSTVASAGGAALASSNSLAAPFHVSVQRDSAGGSSQGTQSSASGPRTAVVPLAIPATMPMGSGAPLGGLGTGFVEIRADGCFYEWQIFNAGPWAQDARSTTAPPGPGPQYLRFLLRARKSSGGPTHVRRLYLRSDDNDLYSLPQAQDVESIDYYAWFPMTGLHYNDPSLPVRVSSHVFSPFIPGNARDSATPGFHLVYTLENTSDEAIDVSLAGFLDNPLASALPDRRLANTLTRDSDATRILFDTSAHSDFPSGIGNLCFSVAGGDPSWIAGTFHEYAQPGMCRWETPRVNFMLLSVMEEFQTAGKLPNTSGSTDPGIGLPTPAEIDSLSAAGLQTLVGKLSADALLARVFDDAHRANPNASTAGDRALLKEVYANLFPASKADRLTWGTGVLASSVHLVPGEKTDIRFTLAWSFPHHLTTSGRLLGHMYSNWFGDAAEVSRFLSANYHRHRAATENFAQTLAATSLGDALAFAWSGQLSTILTNTWWTRDSSYAIWEGLGCCGLSTTDVDYQGSFPLLALFPELKLSQMKQISSYQNERGQVPHNYAGDVHRVDNGFARVDMNSQFVMMVCRDYLWTGDRDYLAVMWPHVVRAMAFTQSLDTNGDALPDHDTGLQTYDQWSMQGTPSYIASLWIGALRAAVRIATAAGHDPEAQQWSALLSKASVNFDVMLFNGDYYSLWADGRLRDELCMTDQISGEWFSHLIGLPTTISHANLHRAIGSVFKNNFNPEFGLHNATAPRPLTSLLALSNGQAGGLWSGIEFAFASLLMDHDRYDDAIQIVEAIHRRYLRAGRPWNHVECGNHYSRAMSSWATLLAATGFKPDLAARSLTLVPKAPGDFHAPWVTAAGFGTLRRAGRTLSLHCASGKLDLASLTVGMPAESVRLDGHALALRAAPEGEGVRFTFEAVIVLNENQTLTIA